MVISVNKLVFWISVEARQNGMIRAILGKYYDVDSREPWHQTPLVVCVCSQDGIAQESCHMMQVCIELHIKHVS